MFVAPDADAFRHLFVNNLGEMLSPDQAGAFILVLANSLQHAELHNSLKPALLTSFGAVRQGIRQGGLDITADDLAVFRSIEGIGIESLSCWAQASTGDWQLVYNPMRALRPARASSRPVSNIRQPFDNSGFNFNRPFLQPEILWQGSWQGTGMRVLYNKFPFAPYHLIIVPDPDLELGQYLSEYYHAIMWELVSQQQDTLPGLGAGYNSLGACASVNQLHFQSFIRAEPLPVELHKWRHNGGDDDYPMCCHVFDTAKHSWQLIAEYHVRNQPYNLLYRSGRCYVLPRRLQGDKQVVPRVTGAGWIEECGVFNVADQADFETVTAAEIFDCLRSLSVNET